MTWDLWRLLRGQPEPPPPAAPPEAPQPGGLPDWRRELLSEASWGWELQRAEPEEAVRAPTATPGQASADPLAGPAPWIRPRTDLPRAFFTRHRYEPGTKPPDAQALRALFEAVYHPCLAPLPSQTLHNLALFGAIDTWRPGDEGNMARAQVIARELAALLGDALAFTPAKLHSFGRLKDDNLGLYSDAERVLRLSTRLLTAHVGGLVNTVVHEQCHHLQNLLMQRLTYAPHKLSPAERSLALYWDGQPMVDPKVHFLFYRLNGRELHAWETAKRVVRDLMPVFGWGEEAMYG